MIFTNTKQKKLNTRHIFILIYVVQRIEAPKCGYFWTRKWDRTVSGILVLFYSPDLGIMATKLPTLW